MSIGTTIKKLRRERSMTQEQLAEYLGITANAVSQWECDRTAPDISQLPMLANIFRVSADVLLEIDVETKYVQIEEIYNQVREFRCTARREEAMKLCREGLRKFPDAYLLMEELADLLSYSSEFAAKEESISLFERIRVGSNDEFSKNYAIGSLCSLYMEIGKQEEAKELAEKVPQLLYTREQCRRMTLRGAEWADDLRTQIESDFQNLILNLRNLMKSFKDEHPLFNEKELLLLWQKVITFIDVFYEDKDYAFDEQLLIEAHFCRAKLYLKIGESNSALDELEAMLTHIQSFERYSEGLLGNHVSLPREKWQTSLLVRPRDENDARLIMCVSSPTSENAAKEYLRKLSANVFDPIRDEVRFCAVEEKLKNTARK